MKNKKECFVRGIKHSFFIQREFTKCLDLQEHQVSVL